LPEFTVVSLVDLIENMQGEPAMFETFGAFLRNLRESLGLSQTEFGRKIGCSASRVAQMEARETPTPELAYKIALTFGFDPADLVMRAIVERQGQPKEQHLKERSSELVLRAMCEAKTGVSMLAMSCVRRVLGARKKLKKMLDLGGTLRVAMLNPSSPFFKTRRREESVNDDEFLLENQITLRLDYEVQAVTEALKGLYGHAAHNSAGSVELRVYDHYPKESITIVDNTLIERYPYRRGHTGPKQPVKLLWGPEPNDLQEAETAFNEVWEAAKAVRLDALADASTVIRLPME
jgi:transcriptional regulator with XRE-family HTH domain